MLIFNYQIVYDWSINESWILTQLGNKQILLPSEQDNIKKTVK